MKVTLEPGASYVVVEAQGAHYRQDLRQAIATLMTAVEYLEKNGAPEKPLPKPRHPPPPPPKPKRHRPQKKGRDYD